METGKVRKIKMEYSRLKKQSDFQRVFAKGKRIFSASMTIIYMPSKEMYMGISVGKRHGKSVQRNRIKRLLREAFRSEADKIKGKYYIIIMPKVRDEYDLKIFKNNLRCMIKKEKL